MSRGFIFILVFIKFEKNMSDIKNIMKGDLENKKNENSDHGTWYEKMGRTVLSREFEFSVGEMELYRIIEVINYEASIDDGLEEGDRVQYLINRGIGSVKILFSAWSICYVDSISRAMIVDSSLRTKGKVPVRVYSGIVFRNQFWMHMYVLKRGDMFPNMNFLSRLVN